MTISLQFASLYDRQSVSITRWDWCVFVFVAVVHVIELITINFSFKCKNLVNQPSHLLHLYHSKELQISTNKNN